MKDKIKLNDIIIRKATKNDAQSLLNLTSDILSSSDYLILTKEEFDFTVNEEEIWIDSFEKEDLNCLLVAEIDSEIIGNLSFKINQNKRICHVGELSMAIDEKYRNIGIGTRLLKYFFDFIIEQKLDFIKINLSVIEDNIPAIELYKKFNFEIEGCLRKSVLIDNEYRNLLLMSKMIYKQ